MRTPPLPSPPRFRLGSLLLLGLTLVAGSAGLAGCGGTLSLAAERAEVITPGAARVQLLETSENLIHIRIYNQAAYPLFVYRDNFLLSTPTGIRTRLAGGVAHAYTVNPGGRHDVKLRYDLTGLGRGATVALTFQSALQVNGQPLPLEALPFVVR